MKAVLQRKCACGGASGPSGECSACKHKGSLQKMLRINQPGDRFEQKADQMADRVMRSTNSVLQTRNENRFNENLCTGEAPAIVHDVIQSQGRPLDASTQQFMQSRFGYDFRQVRIHSDPQAAKSAQAINTQAYTVGRDVVFGGAQYQPGTNSERYLLAHELAHVVQQNPATKGNHQALMTSPICPLRKNMPCS